MYCRWIFFTLKIKKFIKILPVILLETILFVLILLGVGAYATKAVYGEKAVKEIRVGIVAEGESGMADMLVRLVGSMDSMKDTVSLEMMSVKEAEDRLKEGEIYAAVILPEELVDSILSGENIPARILTGNAYAKIETEVFTQLSRSGALLLTTAQAGIYAADTFCMENGRADLIEQTEKDLNEIYLKYALQRSAVFKEKKVNAIKGVNLTDYYAVSLLFAFLSFVGLSFARYMQVDRGEKEKLVKSRGIGSVQQYLIETAAFSGVFAFLGTVLSLPVYLLIINNSKSSFTPSPLWLAMVILWLMVGVFLRSLFQILGNHTGSIGVCFILLMILMFSSGVFIPPAFLPIFVEKIGNYIPYKTWMEGMVMILQGNISMEIVIRLLLIGLLSAVIGVLASVVRENLGGCTFKRRGK